MKDEPVRPLDAHEPASAERTWLGSVGYLLALAVVVGLAVAMMFGVR